MHAVRVRIAASGLLAAVCMLALVPDLQRRVFVQCTQSYRPATTA